MRQIRPPAKCELPLAVSPTVLGSRGETRALRHAQWFARRLAVTALWILLSAQLAAIAHAYSHDTALQRVVQQSSPTSHELCGDCLAHSPLLTAVGAAPPPRIARPPGLALSVTVTVRSLADLSLTVAFRSRAPPLA